MSTPPPETIFQGYDDQSDLNKLAEKTKKSPLVPIGMLLKLKGTEQLDISINNIILKRRLALSLIH